MHCFCTVWTHSRFAPGKCMNERFSLRCGSLKPVLRATVLLYHGLAILSKLGLDTSTLARRPEGQTQNCSPFPERRVCRLVSRLHSSAFSPFLFPLSPWPFALCSFLHHILLFPVYHRIDFDLGVVSSFFGSLYSCKNAAPDWPMGRPSELSPQPSPHPPKMASGTARYLRYVLFTFFVSLFPLDGRHGHFADTSHN